MSQTILPEPTAPPAAPEPAGVGRTGRMDATLALATHASLVAQIDLLLQN